MTNEIDLKEFIKDPFADTELSPLARRIGLLAAKGLTEQEIADQVGRHKETVRRHLEKINRTAGTERSRDLPKWLFDQIEQIVERI
jgi:DNA-binding CsgD family transcriptional regulator